MTMGKLTCAAVAIVVGLGIGTAHAESWLDSIKGALGWSDDAADSATGSAEDAAKSAGNAAESAAGAVEGATERAASMPESAVEGAASMAKDAAGGAVGMGKEMTKEEFLDLLPACDMLNLAGEEIISLAKGLGLVEDENIITIANIPHAQCVVVR